MTPQEKERIRQFDERLTQPVSVEFYKTEDPRSRQMEEFCSELNALASKIDVVTGDDDTGSLPSIGVGPRFRYRGLPSGTELDPFLEAISMAASDSAPLPEALKRRLSVLNPPADVLIYVSPFCHFCPGVLRQLLPMPFASPSVFLTVVDGAFFEELAQRDRIKAVPTTIVDQQYRWTGALSADQLGDALDQRDPAKAGRATLERSVLGGGAGDLARLMIDRNRIFPALAELLVEENFSLRLAAMVTMEELAQNAPELASAFIDPLWERFPEAAVPVKGDILYILGEIGSPRSLPYLEAVLNDAHHPDVLEAAHEAIEKIKQT
jgi:alkyl hydroperoxide reductase subunit AhpF